MLSRSVLKAGGNTLTKGHKAKQEKLRIVDLYV